MRNLKNFKVTSRFDRLDLRVKTVASNVGFGTQVDIGRLDEFIPIGTDDPLTDGFADNFIELLENFGYTVDTPDYSSDDVRVSRRYMRVGNNINVDGSMRIRVSPESALFVTIVVLQQIGLMSIIEALSAIIVSFMDASILDIPGFITTVTDDIVPKIVDIGNGPGLVTVPFRLNTIKERDFDEQYIISEQTFVDDLDENKTVEISGAFPQIGSGIFDKLRKKILVNELDDLIALAPNSIPDTFTIPTEDINSVLSTFAGLINSVLGDTIQEVIDALNPLFAGTIDDIVPVTIDPISDIEVPLGEIVAGIIETTNLLLGATIKLITLTSGIKDTSYSILGDPGTKEICLDFFRPLSSRLIKKLYDVVKEVISVANTATGDFKIPMELLRSIASLITLIIEIYVVGETKFSYSYRCNPDQVQVFG